MEFCADYIVIGRNSIESLKNPSWFRSRMSIRLQPKSLASMDHPPGPTSARARPRVPVRMETHGSPGREMTFQNSRIATRDPETGVHSPTSRRIPAPAATMSGMAPVNPRATRAAAVTIRSRSRPRPGGPWANVEKRRLKTPPYIGRLWDGGFPPKPLKAEGADSFEAEEDPARRGARRPLLSRRRGGRDNKRISRSFL